jgi:3-methylcrotonyl-CoA carboxylase beta subunit
VKGEQLEREGKSWSPGEEEAYRAPILEKYEVEGSPYYSTARLWDDGVIPPSETRTVLGLGISAALNAPIHEPRFGVFRM